jgi:hypothetical protein
VELQRIVVLFILAGPVKTLSHQGQRQLTKKPNKSNKQGLAMASTWIFQGNPDYFDIQGYLELKAPRISWLVRRYADHMVPGDRVFLWQAGGKQKAESGIIASGRIVSDVWNGPDEEAAIPFWRDDSAGHTPGTRIWISVDKAASSKKHVIKRKWLKTDPVCRDLLILRQPAGTNYRVKPLQSQRLESLWAKTGLDWSWAESLAGLHLYLKLYGLPVSKLPGSPVADRALLIGRAVSGVYNKVMNFRNLDPRDTRKGQDGWGKTDKLVWDQFYDSVAESVDSHSIQSEFDKIWADAWVHLTAETQWATLDETAEQELESDLNALLARYRARSSRQPPRSGTTSATVYDRDPDVIAIAKIRADYHCEVPGCKQPLFVKRDGKPYVEVHHIVTLAEDGFDTPDNVACLCPSHHREIHHGRNAEELRQSLQSVRNSANSQAQG